MARDLYTDSRRLASSLSEAGLTEWSSRIEEIIVAGSTATEILMGLRWLLGELLAHESTLSEVLRAEAIELEKAIGEILA